MKIPVRGLGCGLAASVAALLLAACPKERSMTTKSGVSVTWAEVLRGAAIVQTGTSTIGGTWLEPMYDAPSPGETVLYAQAGMVELGRDRGWLLRAGASPQDTLLVDEGAEPLSYAIRRLGERQTVPVPSPDGASWPLRALACAGEDMCVVARWSPVPGQSAAPGKRERLALVGVNAKTLAFSAPSVFEVADLHAGTAALGGVVANPARADAYVIERTVQHVVVHAVGLAGPTERWKAEVPMSGAGPDAPDAAELVPAADGATLFLVQGREKRGVLEVHDVRAIDADSGALRRIDIDRGASMVLATPVDGSSSILTARIVVAGGGETPDLTVRDVSRLDAASGSSKPLLERAAIPLLDGRPDAPSFMVAVDSAHLLFVPRGLRTPYPQDPSPESVRTQRRRAVFELLGKQVP